MNHWLVKQEPEAYAWSRFLKDGRTAWTGVRNYQARNHLRSMKLNDRVLYYHSVTGKEIVGEAKVVKEAYPDPTAKEGDWSCVDLEPVQTFSKTVALADIKNEPELSNMALLRQSRLSVMPLRPSEYRRLCAMGGLGKT